MIKNVQKITLDLSGKDEHLVVHAKQFDKDTREINCTLISDGVKVELSENETIELRCLKPDNTSCQCPVTKNDDGTVTVILAEQAISAEGFVKADLVVVDNEGAIISTSVFYIHVIPAAMNGNYMPSEDYFKRMSDIDMNSHSIINLAAPSADGDAVNKAYVDSLIGNGELDIPIKIVDDLDGMQISTLEKVQPTGLYIATALRDGNNRLYGSGPFDTDGKGILIYVTQSFMSASVSGGSEQNIIYPQEQYFYIFDGEKTSLITVHFGSEFVRVNPGDITLTEVPARTVDNIVTVSNPFTDELKAKLESLSLTGGSGGTELVALEENYEVVADVTLAEDTTQLQLERDDNAVQLNLDNVLVLFTGRFTSALNNTNLLLRFNGGNIYQMYCPFTTPSSFSGNFFFNIKSEKIYHTDNYSVWTSEYPKGLMTANDNGIVQGTAQHNADIRTSISVQNHNNNATMIGFGFPTNDTEHKMSAGSRIVILTKKKVAATIGNGNNGSNSNSEYTPVILADTELTEETTVFSVRKYNNESFYCNKFVAEIVIPATETVKDVLIMIKGRQDAYKWAIPYGTAKTQTNGSQHTLVFADFKIEQYYSTCTHGYKAVSTAVGFDDQYNSIPLNIHTNKVGDTGDLLSPQGTQLISVCFNNGSLPVGTKIKIFGEIKGVDQ